MRPLPAEASRIGTAWVSAVLAVSASFALSARTTRLTLVRIFERMLALLARLRVACRARFLAWAEFATASGLPIRARLEGRAIMPTERTSYNTLLDPVIHPLAAADANRPTPAAWNTARVLGPTLPEPPSGTPSLRDLRSLRHCRYSRALASRSGEVLGPAFRPRSVASGAGADRGTQCPLNRPEPHSTR